MKKKVTVLGIIFTMLFTMIAFSACGGGAADQSTEEEATAESQYGEGYEFKQGFDNDYRPYSFYGDDGKTGGFDVEMAQAVCDYYGWTYKAVPFSWDAKDAELQSGACDCIWSGFTINGREDDYLWSMPYSDNTQKIMVKNDSGIAKLSDLAGKKVGVQTATSAFDLLNSEEGQKELRDTFGDLLVFDNYTIAITDLKAGAVDAVAVDATRAAEAMANDDSLVCLEENLGSEQYGIGFRKDDKELCKLVNDALDALAADGTVEKIVANYPEIAEYITLGK